MKRKTIKVEDLVYTRVLALQRTRETQGDVVERLLNLWDDTVGVISHMQPLRPDPQLSKGKEVTQSGN